MRNRCWAALVTISIDDTLKTAGPGGWASGPAKEFRVTGVPTCYIIDAEGKIAAAGHPMGLQVPQKVDELLDQARPKP